MRTIFFIFFAFYISVNAQTLTSLEVIYSQKYNLKNYNEEQYYVLNYDDNISNYKQIYFEKKVGFSQEIEDNKTTVTINSNNDALFFTTNFTKKNIIYNSVIADKTIIIEDTIIAFNWSILDEFKKIGNYNVQKAITKFRGRNYEAWFTNEIPVFYGPWKFNNLGGLILEVYDIDYKIHILAKEIKTVTENKKTESEIKYKEIIKINNLESEILKIREAFLDKINSKLPKGAKPIKVDKDCTDCGEELEIFE